MSDATALEIASFWEPLSAIGDAPMEGVFDRTSAQAFMRTYTSEGSAAAMTTLPSTAQESAAAVCTQHHESDTEPDLPDPIKVAAASELFGRYGTEIAASLLIAALPQAYASPKGATVLASTDELQKRVSRRIAGTAQFVVNTISGTSAPRQGATIEDREVAIRDSLWLRSGADPAEWASAARATYGLRLLHQAVRTISGAPCGRPAINQEDLLATLLLFTVGTFEVLERFGIAWTADEQEAYLYTWCHIGKAIGIMPSIAPASVAEARVRAEQSRTRLWAPGIDGLPLDERLAELANGRRLVRALLTELEAAMPARYRRWPGFVMRQLAPQEVRDILALGSNGTFGVMLRSVPPRRTRTARFTVEERPNTVAASVLRGMANQVAQRTMLELIKNADPPLTIPGLSPSVTYAVRSGR